MKKIEMLIQGQPLKSLEPLELLEPMKPLNLSPFTEKEDSYHSPT